jgi:hypothetical protein
MNSAKILNSLSMLSGNIFKTMKFEISHFVQDDNKLVIYLEGIGWRRSRQPIPSKTKALKTPSFRVLTPIIMGHNADMTGRKVRILVQ